MRWPGKQTTSVSGAAERMLIGVLVLVWRLLGLLAGVLFYGLALATAGLLLLRFWWWRRYLAKPRPYRIGVDRP